MVGCAPNWGVDAHAPKRHTGFVLDCRERRVFGFVLARHGYQGRGIAGASCRSARRVWLFRAAFGHPFGAHGALGPATAATWKSELPAAQHRDRGWLHAAGAVAAQTRRVGAPAFDLTAATRKRAGAAPQRRPSLVRGRADHRRPSHRRAGDYCLACPGGSRRGAGGRVRPARGVAGERWLRGAVWHRGGSHLLPRARCRLGAARLGTVLRPVGGWRWANARYLHWRAGHRIWTAPGAGAAAHRSPLGASRRWLHVGRQQLWLRALAAASVRRPRNPGGRGNGARRPWHGGDQPVLRPTGPFDFRVWYF